MAYTINKCLLFTFLAFLLESLAFGLPGWKFYNETNFEGIFLNCPGSWKTCEKKFTLQTLRHVFNLHTRDGTLLVTQALGVACTLIALVLNILAARSKHPKTVQYCRVGLITLALFGGYFISMGVIVEANAGLQLIWVKFGYCYFLAISATCLSWVAALIAFLHKVPPVNQDKY